MTSEELFTTAPVKKAYWNMTIPVILSSLGSVIYNLADTYFISQTNRTELVAGVSLCAPIMLIMVALGDIWGIGGSSIITRLFGKGDDEGGRRTAGFCIYASIASGLLFAVIMALFSDPILNLLGVEEQTYEFARAYYLWLIPYAPLCAISVTLSNIIRAEGMVKENLISNVAGYIANIILDPILIFVCDMGAGGAALATAISRAITVACFFAFIALKSKKLSLSPKGIKIPGKSVGTILSIGVPASMTNILNSAITTVLNLFLLEYGVDKVASMGIASKINMIVIMITVGLAFGCQPLLGFNYGAGNEKRLKAFIRFDVEAILAVTIALAVILSFTAAPLMTLFMDDAGIVADGSVMIRFLLLSGPLSGVCMVFVTLFQAEGKALPAFLLTVLRQGVYVLLAMYLLHLAIGYYGILLATPCADALAVVTALLLYRGQKKI